jgi:HK97 gp10 family phage protein
MSELSRVVAYHNSFFSIASGLPPAGRVACRHTAEQIVEIAREKVPVLTGALQATIQVRPVARGYSASAGGTGSTNSDGIDYGPFVEFGTVYMGAQPFFFPAVEAVRGEFEESMAVTFRAYFAGAHFGVSLKGL